MPAAPMLACAARASDAAWLRSPPRARRCRAGAGRAPWYACRPAKRRPPSGGAARRRAARAARRRAAGAPQRPWPTSTSTKTSIVAAGRAVAARARRSMPSDRVDGDRQADASGQRGDARELVLVDHLVADVDVVDAARRRAPRPRSPSARRRRPRRPRSAAARSSRSCASSRAAAGARRGRARSRPCAGDVALHRVEVDDERRRVDRLDQMRRGRRARAPRLMRLRSARRGTVGQSPSLRVVERAAVEVRVVAPADQREALAG